MATTWIMGASAAVLLLAGAGMTFLPQELLSVLGAGELATLIAIVQLCGAAYLGMAMLNWLARRNLIGGIYSRPVAFANFLHFFAAAMALFKLLPASGQHPLLLAAAIIGSVFALLFGIVLFRPGLLSRAD